MLLDLDYSTFVLLPGTKNPVVGMMMQTTHGGATVVLDEHLAELESGLKGDPTSPHFSPSTPPGARPQSTPFVQEEAPPCRNGASCSIPMCTYSHASSHFPPNRTRLSFSSAPFMPSYSPTSSPVKQQQHRFEPNKNNYSSAYENNNSNNFVAPPSRASSNEVKHFDVFAAPLGLSSRTPSIASSRSSTSSLSPERSPDLPTRTLGGPANRRMNVPTRKPQGHFDTTFGPQTNAESYGEFTRHQTPIVVYNC